MIKSMDEIKLEQWKTVINNYPILEIEDDAS